MRVLVLSSVFPSATRPSYGTFVRQRVRRIAAHCAVEVIAPVPWFPFNRLIRGSEQSDVPRRETDGGLQVHHPRVFSLPAVGKAFDAFFYFLSILLFVRRLRRRFPFDVIDAHFAYPDGVAAVLLGAVFSRPIVLTMRGNEVVIARHLLRRWQMRFALQRARVIAVSSGLRDLAVSLGAPAERVRVIPNGIDAALFHPRGRDDARDALGLPRDRPIIVSIAAYVVHKGHELVLDALQGLRRVSPTLLYVAVGNRGGGESRLAALRTRLRDEGLTECVRLEVARPHDEIPLWLAAADIFCLATQREGSNNAILEALACGVPVVTTDIPGNREIIRDGENGFLVPYFDAAAFTAAILRALDRQWDRAAIANAMTRTWDEVGEEAVQELRLAAASLQSEG